MSTERDHELERLAVADRHIAEAEQHIAEQLARVEQTAGHDAEVTSAEGLLVTLNAMLMEWKTQRDEILKCIKQLEAKDNESVSR